MTALTGCRRRQVVVRLAARDRPVMAAGATRADGHVGVELGWRPGRVALVAGRATGRCRNVGSVLARRLDTIVTTGAIGGRCEGAVIGLGALPLAR